MAEEYGVVTVRARLSLTNIRAGASAMVEIRQRPIPDIFRVPVAEVGGEVTLFLPIPCDNWMIVVVVPALSILPKTHNIFWTVTQACNLTVAALSMEATPSLPQAVAMRQDIQATDMQE